MVSNVASTSLIARYLCLSFLSFRFTCLFHSQSFQKTSQRSGECAIHLERDVCEEQHPCGANKQK